MRVFYDRPTLGFHGKADTEEPVLRCLLADEAFALSLLRVRPSVVLSQLLMGWTQVQLSI